MAKHIDWRIKLMYVSRHIYDFEQASQLELELVQKNLSNSKGSKPGKGTNKPSVIIIHQWVYKYQRHGIIGLMSKKKKLSLDQYTKEELMEIIRILEGTKKDELEKKVNHKNIKKYRKDKKCVSNQKMIDFFCVASSTFYKKNDQIKLNKYHNTKILIKKIWDKSNKTYGYKRVYIELKMHYKVKISRKKVLQLMQEMNIRSIIKTKNRRKDPKNMRTNIPNLDKNDFHQTNLIRNILQMLLI